MEKITFDEYKNAIRAEFEAKKYEGVYGSGDISNITPAQLRNLCLCIAEIGLNKTDENIFRYFFNAKEDEKLERAIDNFGTGKLKSVISFLKGEKNSENPTRIELVAIIVDFNPRPRKRYLQIYNAKEIDTENLQIEEGKEIGNYFDLGQFENKEVVIEDKIAMKKGVLFLMVFLFLLFAIVSIKHIFFPTKECMQWNGNHYEEVDCSNNKLGIGQLDMILPIDNQTMKLVKLDSKEALVFFKNEKPLVWYFKKDGDIELFNQPGFYPETDKPLKPITDYIIKKYKLKSKE